MGLPSPATLVEFLCNTMFDFAAFLRMLSLVKIFKNIEYKVGAKVEALNPSHFTPR